ncbi:MAG: energy-coupling factor ABC transporter ATP-binding protein [Deltaproteobacteria bacterium]|nr:energy-coupling factor ABC transporter ATP-binding protein [Deltaproteobacteria bacterium]
MHRKELYSIERVSYSYGGFQALNDIELKFYEGECTAVLGANGSGKSTLLKLLDALIHPTKGVIKFYGEPMKKGFNSTGFRERVGFVFHEADSQLFCPTVYEEIAFGPRQLKLLKEEIEGRVEDTLKMLGLGHLRDRAPYTLSSGEKKKVAIASVLSSGPEVLILDEPTNGLDPRTQVWLVELLAALCSSGKTIIMATHDLSLAADFSARVVILDEAHRIAADGDPKGILTNKTLLLDCNLIHEHAHRHGDVVHTHSHGPFAVHDEHD